MKNLLLTFFICFCSTLPAQEKVWTLNECMQYAVEHSPKRGKQNAQNKIYNQNYTEAIAGLLPKVNASVGTTFSFGRGLDSETNTYVDRNSFSNSYSAYASVLLFDGLTQISKIKMQKINRIMGKEQLRQTEDMLAFDTMEIFFNVLYYQGTANLAEQQLNESQTFLKQINRMEELGLKAAPDVLEIKAKAASDKYNLIKQQNLLEIEIIKLKEKMNFPIDSILKIDTLTNIDILPVTESENALSIFDRAVNYSPKVKASEKAFEAQKAQYKSSKGSLYPSLYFEGGYSTSFSRWMDGSTYTPFKDQIRDRRGHYFAFTLSIPLFNGLSSISTVKRSKQNMIIAQYEYEETKRTVYSEIEQAVADMNGQAEEYQQALQQEDAMEAAHKVNQRKYTEGLISALELNTSANRFLNARVEKLNAGLKYNLKAKLVKYYKGEPFIQ